MTVEKLIKVRSAIKSRKPTFARRQGIRQFAKLKKSGWRFPKGMGNKVRRGRRGQPIKPTCGFGSPRAVKGLNKAGFEEVLVFNVSDLSKITSDAQVAVISRTVGGRKKLDILAAGKVSKISFANVKDIESKISELTKVKSVKPVKKVEKKVVSEKKSEEKPKKKATAKKTTSKKVDSKKKEESKK